MSKHTAGPWHTVDSIGPNFGDIAICAAENSRDGKPIIVAECFSDLRHGNEHANDEARANASILAAAPELLSAAKDSRALLARVGCPVDWLDMLISKAEGT